jgi:formaldehyde dismutase / methanol dehydrogenase
MGLKHLLLVTSGLRGTGIVDEVTRNLEDAGVAVTVYDKVESNPKGSLKNNFPFSKRRPSRP